MYDVTIHVEDEKDLYNSFDSSKEIPAIRLQSAMIKVLENYKVVVKSK